MNRRSFLLTLAAGGAAAIAPERLRVQTALVRPSPADDALLDDIAHRSFQFFWEQSDPQTGIVRGRALSDGSDYPKERRDVGTTGGTGFALTALCIGAERKWISRDEARERVRATLRAYANGPVKHEHG